MLLEASLFLGGFVSALLCLAAVLFALLTAARSRSRDALRAERQRLAGLKRLLPAPAPTPAAPHTQQRLGEQARAAAKPEWSSCRGVTLYKRPATPSAGDAAAADAAPPAPEPIAVRLRASIPLLFILSDTPDGGSPEAGGGDAKAEETRIGTILLERCQIRLLKKQRPLKYASSAGAAARRLRPRWHCDNLVILTSKVEGDPVLTEADGACVMEVWLGFPLNRELERWFGILQQGASFSAPDPPLGAHPQQEPFGRKAAVWRSRFATLIGDMETAFKPPAVAGVEEGGPLFPPQLQTDVCANVVLAKFLNFWRTREAFTGYIKKKINKQLAKVEKPKMLKGGFEVSGVELGEALPVVSGAEFFGIGTTERNTSSSSDTPTHPNRHALSGGDFAIEADVSYTGGEFAVLLEMDFDVQVEALDFSIPLPKVLARVQVTGLTGRLRLEFSAFSDYLWFGFVGEPQLALRITTDTPDLPLRILSAADIPELTELAVTFLQKELIELVVYPNMEDLYIPLINEEEEEDTSAVITSDEWGSFAGAPASISLSFASVPDGGNVAAGGGGSGGGGGTPLSAPSERSSPVDASHAPPAKPAREIKGLGKTKVNMKDLLKTMKKPAPPAGGAPAAPPPQQVAPVSAAAAPVAQQQNQEEEDGGAAEAQAVRQPAEPPAAAPAPPAPAAQWQAQPQWGGAAGGALQPQWGASGGSTAVAGQGGSSSGSPEVGSATEVAERGAAEEAEEEEGVEEVVGGDVAAQHEAIVAMGSMLESVLADQVIPAVSNAIQEAMKDGAESAEGAGGATEDTAASDEPKGRERASSSGSRTSAAPQQVKVNAASLFKSTTRRTTTE